MTNLYFEISRGSVFDVTRSVPKKMEIGFKYIIQGGDFVEFSRIGDRIKVIRGKGGRTKVEKVLDSEGVYLLTPVYLEMINKLNVKYRRVYGMLRENFGEDFYLSEDENLKQPFEIRLNLEVDIVVRYRFDVSINSNLITSNDISLIKTLINNTLSLDLVSIGRLSDKPMIITINQLMINELSRIIDMGKTKMVI